MIVPFLLSYICIDSFVPQSWRIVYTCHRRSSFLPVLVFLYSFRFKLRVLAYVFGSRQTDARQQTLKQAKNKQSQ